MMIAPPLMSLLLLLLLPLPLLGLRLGVWQGLGLWQGLGQERRRRRGREASSS
jgi:hypothetical protein